MQRTVTKRVLSAAGAAVIGGLLSAAVAQEAIIRIIGSSPNSWEEAAKTAVEEGAAHLQGVRTAEVEALDMRLEGGFPVEYRARMLVEFLYPTDPASADHTRLDRSQVQVRERAPF